MKNCDYCDESVDSATTLIDKTDICADCLTEAEPVNA